ncbi:MAG: tetratricopeptide repeat protein [Syntrophotaleaceae bacterium]
MSKKEKLLAAAQKNLLKGQVAKAIKDYEKVIESNPNDVRNRQKLGELYNRVGMTAEALEAYDWVARHYAKNGFYLKAIAVYKQMQKIDGSQGQIYFKLAELNEKQGLLGNALGEYRQLIKLLAKQDKPKDLIKVQEKMKDLDPDNIQLRVELAAAYAAQEDGGQPAEVLGQALEHLAGKKDLACPAALRQALEKYCPDKIELKVDLARVLLERGDNGGCIDLLQEVLAVDPQNRDAVLLLADGYHACGEFPREQEVCSRFLENSAHDLDIREKSVRAHLACGDQGRAFDELEEWKGAFFDDQRLAVLKDFYERFREFFPENEAVHKTLQAVYEKTGEGSKLFDLMSSDRKEAETGSEADPGLQEDAGQEEILAYGELPDEEPAVADKSPVEEPEQADLPDPEPESFRMDDDGDNLEFEIELEINEPEVSPETFEASHLDFGSLDLEASVAEENGLDLDEIIGGLGELEQGKKEDASPLDVKGDLEEAEFYLEQGLLEEAEKKCRNLLAAVPGCEEARQLLERILPAAPVSESGAQGGEVAGSGNRSKQAPETRQDREKSRLDGSLSEFKKGLENQISAEDTETHYNLGIAYKEMGLLDDAIEQFEKAMLDPGRRVDCLTLKGVCLVQKGEFEKAVEAFKAGLALDDLKNEERTCFHYELGILYQSWQRPLEALESFQCVAEAEPFFRDVESRIKDLRKELGLAEDEGAEGSGGKSSKNRISYI